MDGISAILASPDVCVHSRLITYISSLLSTKPGVVITDFESFQSFFSSLISTRESDSINFYILNDLLYDAIMNFPDKIPQKSVVAILNYVAECFSFSRRAKINGFVSEIYDTYNFVEMTNFLIEEKSGKIISEESYISLLTILCIAEDITILNSYSEKIAKYISNMNDPENILELVMNSILSTNEELSNFCVSLALNIISNNKDIMKSCVNYAPSIQLLPSYESNKEMQKLKDSLVSLLVNNNMTVTPVSSPYSSLAKSMFEQKTFEIVDSRGTKKFLTMKHNNISRNSNQIQPNNLTSQFLEINEMDLSVGVKKDNEDNQQKLKMLRALVLKKKDGPLHTQWKKRWFEFYPHNKCIIWRAEQTLDGIKGILFLDHSIKIEKNNNNLIIKSDSKTHQMQFDNSQVADEWYLVLSLCTRQ